MHGDDCSALTERADAIGTADHVFEELGLASPVFRAQLVVEAFEEALERGLQEWDQVVPMFPTWLVSTERQSRACH